jgi:mono/diheme cytochrome c family protein
MKKTFTVIALTALVWGCAKKVTPVASTNGGSSNTATVVKTTTNTSTDVVVPVSADPVIAKSSEMLGQQTYTAKCGRCHGLKVTTDYTADRWIGIMESMAPKAHLDAAEKENVLVYVKTNAKK